MADFSKRFLAVFCAGLILVPVCTAQKATKPKKPPAKPAPKHSSHTANQGAGPSKLVHASSKKAVSKKRKRANWRKRGQQKIDAQRTRDIQEALIREHYLDGPASGVWDDKSQKAMQKFQADQGWQSKTTPDSRALIKLGLGPDHANLLNPETAMTGMPDKPGTGESTSKPAAPIPSVSALPVVERAPSSHGESTGNSSPENSIKK